MNIAIYVSKAMYLAKDTKVVSGHVQVALKTAEILSDLGHRVTLITTKASTNYSIPHFPRLSKINFEFVTSGTKKWPRHKSISLSGAFHLLFELRKILNQGKYDVLHFFGSNKSAYLLTCMKCLGVQGKTIMTFVNYRKINNLIYTFFLKPAMIRSIDYSLTATDYIGKKLKDSGFKAVFVNRIGFINKKSADEIKPIKFRENSKDLILFWRDAEYSNGVDVCMEVFRKMSREFPDVDFVFAVRPGHTFEKKLKEIDKHYENIYLLLYPYKNNMTIERLIVSATCVVMPFRKLSVNPQMALLETLSLGSFLITTNIESNRELTDITDAVWFVEPNNSSQISSAIKFFLKNKTKIMRAREKVKLNVFEKWNWDQYRRNLKEIYNHLIYNDK